MIRNRWNDKKADIQGLKKQTSSLLNCAWEKGYVAGFDDGYKSGRQAEKRPKGKWIFNEKMYHQYCCSECGLPMPAVNDYYREKIIGCPYCLADMRGDVL